MPTIAASVPYQFIFSIISQETVLRRGISLILRMEIMIALRIAPAAADDEHGQLLAFAPTASPERQMRKRRAGRTTKGDVSRKHFRADSPVFFDLNHGHLTLAIIMA